MPTNPKGPRATQSAAPARRLSPRVLATEAPTSDHRTVQTANTTKNDSHTVLSTAPPRPDLPSPEKVVEAQHVVRHASCHSRTRVRESAGACQSCRRAARQGAAEDDPRLRCHADPWRACNDRNRMARG